MLFRPDTSILNRSVDSEDVAGLYVYGGPTTSVTTNFNNLSRNTFTTSGNGNDGYGWYIDGHTAISGKVNGNTFRASDNGEDGNGWFINENTTISGNVSGNTFTISNNGGLGFGWQIADTTVVNGNVSRNVFTTSSNQGSQAYGFYIRANNSRIEKAVSDNTFNITGNAFAAGWAIVGITSIGGDVSGNTFTVTGNDDGYGWATFSSTTIESEVINNSFIISGNSSDNIGINVEITTGETLNFEQSVHQNMMRINGDLTGDYGFSLHTGFSTGGVINFDENTESNLISLNNNASVITGGSGTINYNG